MKASLLVCLVGLAGLRVGLAADITWETDANMDRQLFPALIIATATQRPQDDEDTKPDPEVLGDEYGAVGVSLKAPKAGTKVQVTLKENAVMNASSWSGTLEKAGTEYYIAPKINYKFDKLRETRAQVPLNVTLAVDVDGKSLGEKTETLTLRSINDCPFGVSEAEATIDDEEEASADEAETKEAQKKEAQKKETSGNAGQKTSGKDSKKAGGGGLAAATGDEESDSTAATDQEEETTETEPSSGKSRDGYTDMGWMFAAYVNEDSPIVETILKEALATKIVDSFAGYQKNPDEVVKEVLAIWTALQKRGIHYSNITTTAGGSETVYSQHVRFVNESIANEQANCVDGSVLFASILRKLGLRAFLVTVPHHMFMGFYLNADGDQKVALETTMIGSREDQEAKALKAFSGLQDLRGKLDKTTAESVGWKTFATALAIGTQNLTENEAKFQMEDQPQYQITDINEARKDGIMPISYQKSD